TSLLPSSATTLLPRLSLAIIPRPPRHTLFPYTTLFRSHRTHRVPADSKRSKHCRECLLDCREIRRLAILDLAPKCKPIAWGLRRSEEHTSELQSRENLVCRLLLEKKKTS